MSAPLWNRGARGFPFCFIHTKLHLTRCFYYFRMKALSLFIHSFSPILHWRGFSSNSGWKCFGLHVFISCFIHSCPQKATVCSAWLAVIVHSVVARKDQSHPRKPTGNERDVTPHVHNNWFCAGRHPRLSYNSSEIKNKEKQHRATHTGSAEPNIPGSRDGTYLKRCLRYLSCVLFILSLNPTTIYTSMIGQYQNYENCIKTQLRISSGIILMYSMWKKTLDALSKWHRVAMVTSRGVVVCHLHRAPHALQDATGKHIRYTERPIISSGMIMFY